LVEKIFKNNRFRIESIFSNQKKTKPLGEEEEISRPLSSFNFEFSITLPKEVRTKTTYITKNNPVFILELKNN
jgi:hypothetical protein